MSQAVQSQSWRPNWSACSLLPALNIVLHSVRLGCPAMATTAGLPPYMLPGVPVHQPAHLEGDPTLATEILPGPPSLVSAQQSAQKRDPRKPSTAYSYLPLSDPGSTYSGIMHGTLIGHEEPRSKRPRNDKGCAPWSLPGLNPPTDPPFPILRVTITLESSCSFKTFPKLNPALVHVGNCVLPAVQPVVLNVLQPGTNPP
jgi:hypothetical protein